jgi:hypothetical protein
VERRLLPRKKGFKFRLKFKFKYTLARGRSATAGVHLILI